jgi:hypothetical protein
MNDASFDPIRWTLVVAMCVAAIPSAAQEIYPVVPDWESSDTEVSTGAALVDIDRDGWLDLVVANGNDMAQQRLAVYYNQGGGTFPPTPDWQSADVAYNGHLDVADVNADGWPDVAVAVLGRFSVADNAARLYLNNSGTLSSTPDWEADVVAHAFACAFGDVNNDGRPDLAIATGWAYSAEPFDYHQLLYLNNGGTLSASADWSSDDEDHLQGVLWADANRDGWLDLVGVAADAQTRVYTNLGGALETTASWQTTDSAAQDAIMAAAGDVTGDGLGDLIVTNNIQLGDNGRIRQYDGVMGGMYQTTYGWSYNEGYGSAVALADVNGDGDLDLATGAWWDFTRLFLNTGSGLPTVPQWSSAVSSVIEKIVFGDLARDSLRSAVELFPATGDRLFHLGHRPVQEVVAVRRDGVPLGPEEYLVDRDDGWVTTAVPPVDALEVEYSWSTAPDMAVTNWDDTVGNFVYMNRLGTLFHDGFDSGDSSGWSEAVSDLVGARDAAAWQER